MYGVGDAAISRVLNVATLFLILLEVRRSQKTLSCYAVDAIVKPQMLPTQGLCGYGCARLACRSMTHIGQFVVPLSLSNWSSPIHRNWFE